MSERLIEDKAYLQNWFFEHEHSYIIPYIETHFYPESFDYQYFLMNNNLFLGGGYKKHTVCPNDLVSASPSKPSNKL